jgi:hypothetical protein
MKAVEKQYEVYQPLINSSIYSFPPGRKDVLLI